MTWRTNHLPPADLGRPEIRKYIVSIKWVDDESWPYADQKAIAGARDKYSIGTHEMTTGRDGSWLILYCMPRSKRCAPRSYFTEVCV